MARECYFCKKRKIQAVKRVKLRGHYNPTTKRTQKPNLQKFTLPEGKKVLVCTKCLKLYLKKKDSLLKVN